MSRLTSLYSPIKTPQCDHHYHHPVFAHVSHGRDPSFALTTSTAVFSRHGVFPRPAWATHSAELYRQPGRPHQEGRSTRTPLATSGTWNYRATVRYLAPGGQAAEVRQVEVDEHGNQDAPCSIMMGTAIVKPQDFQRQDDVVIQANVRHSACMSIPPNGIFVS